MNSTQTRGLVKIGTGLSVITTIAIAILIGFTYTLKDTVINQSETIEALRQTSVAQAEVLKRRSPVLEYMECSDKAQAFLTQAQAELTDAVLDRTLKPSQAADDALVAARQKFNEAVKVVVNAVNPGTDGTCPGFSPGG